MIIQAIIDFVRDVIVNWTAGFNSLLGGIDASAAGAAVGGAAADAGHVLALFIAPSIWPGVVGAWVVFLSVWFVTAVVAIVGRRLASK